MQLEHLQRCFKEENFIDILVGNRAMQAGWTMVMTKNVNYCVGNKKETAL